MTPLFRIDRVPFLYKGAGLFTLLFELGFFVLPFRSLRPLGAAVAFFFHQSTWVFLGISFLFLQPFLLFLFDIRHAFVHLGNQFYPAPLTLLYNPDESWQQQVVKTLARVDLFDQLRFQAVSRDSSPDPGSPFLAVSSFSSGRQALWINGHFKIGSFLFLAKYVPTVVFLLPLTPLVRRSASTSDVSSASQDQSHHGRRQFSADRKSILRIRTS